VGTFAGVTEPARVVGRVDQVWLYPVKSLAGTSVQGADVVPTGLAGDRVWTVVGDDGGAVRAKDAPALATLDPVTADDQSLSLAAGRPVRLRELPPAPGVAPVHLVSRGAIERAAAGDVPAGCSADDPRANLVLTLDDDERTWVGREVRVGGAVLVITRTPKHCLGVYADVRQPGPVRVGDAVLISPAG
jgi:uncharacterized protein YcbX